MNYPETINNLIECFKHMPGIGEKTAERLALSLLDYDDNTLQLFSESIANVKKKVRRCERCYSFSENNICDICLDEKRTGKTLCVVKHQRMLCRLKKSDHIKESIMF